MTIKDRRVQLYIQCIRNGVRVEQSRPGDGRIRYEFTMGGRVLARAVGLYAAEMFIQGYEEGIRCAE